MNKIAKAVKVAMQRTPEAQLDRLLAKVLDLHETIKGLGAKRDGIKAKREAGLPKPPDHGGRRQEMAEAYRDDNEGRYNDLLEKIAEDDRAHAEAVRAYLESSSRDEAEFAAIEQLISDLYAEAAPLAAEAIQLTEQRLNTAVAPIDAEIVDLERKIRQLVTERVVVQHQARRARIENLLRLEGQLEVPLPAGTWPSKAEPAQDGPGARATALVNKLLTSGALMFAHERAPVAPKAAAEHEVRGQDQTRV